MRRLLGTRGQSMAEYAVLFAIVIGAAVAVQQYVKTRLQGAVRGYADNYITEVKKGVSYAETKFDPARLSNSTSATDQEFTTARDGTVQSLSGSESGINKKP